MDSLVDIQHERADRTISDVFANASVTDRHKMAHICIRGTYKQVFTQDYTGLYS